jgi:CDGSH-type Zn-finger protein
MSAEPTPPAATVTVYPDGPLIVRGDVEVRCLDGSVVESKRTVALCRCGRSAFKPLCDGSHALPRAGARGRLGDVGQR